ncbi:hypothetical protein BH23BAC4_BH23BAC4_15850 [soil metagenome]
MVAITGMYGDTGREPQYAVVALALGNTTKPLSETLPFNPDTEVSQGRAVESTFRGRSAYDVETSDATGFVVLSETAWLATFDMSEGASPESRRALMELLDLDRFFAAAETYRTTDALEMASGLESEVESAPREMRLVSWAHIVESDLVDAIIEIGDEHILFASGHPQLDEFDPMDIVLSHHEANPFLRRVIFVEQRGETVYIETRPASLEEAIAPW